MKKIQLILRKTALMTAGKALALFGIVITCDGCFPVAYGCPPPQPPDYWSDQEPELKEPVFSSTQHQEYEQTTFTNTQDGIEERL